MATFSEIQTRVTRRVIDAPASVVTEVPALINEAMKALQERHNFRVMETLSSLYVTVAATRALAVVPSDWKEARGNPWYVPNTAGPIRPMKYSANRPAVQSVVNPTDTGYPRFLLESEPTDAGARNLEIWPLSDSRSDYSGGQYRIYVPYWRFLPALSAGADTNWFTVNAEEYLIHVATGQAFSLNWDESRLVLWTQLGENKYNQAVKRDKMARLAGVNTLVTHWRGANSPLTSE